MMYLVIHHTLVPVGGHTHNILPGKDTFLQATLQFGDYLISLLDYSNILYNFLLKLAKVNIPQFLCKDD